MGIPGRADGWIVPQDVEANTVRLKEHGKVVLVLQKDLQGGSGQAASVRSSR